MLNLTTAGAEAVCASHGDHAKPADGSAAAADEHHAHDSHAALPSGSEEREACDAPTGSDCCPVAITCSFSFGAMPVASVISARTAHEAVTVAPDAVIRSPHTGPEPPPPRA